MLLLYLELRYFNIRSDSEVISTLSSRDWLSLNRQTPFQRINFVTGLPDSNSCRALEKAEALSRQHSVQWEGGLKDVERHGRSLIKTAVPGFHGGTEENYETAIAYQKIRLSDREWNSVPSENEACLVTKIIQIAAWFRRCY